MNNKQCHDLHVPKVMHRENIFAEKINTVKQGLNSRLTGSETDDKLRITQVFVSQSHGTSTVY